MHHRSWTLTFSQLKICCNLYPLLYCLFKKFLFVCLFVVLERGREGEREGGKHDVWEIHQSVSLTHPQLGTWPKTQACALTGNRTCHLSVCRSALNPLSAPVRAFISFFLSFCLHSFEIDFKERGQEREREREALICFSTHSCIHRLILVCTWPGTKPTTVAYWDEALTKWATS